MLKEVKNMDELEKLKSELAAKTKEVGHLKEKLKVKTRRESFSIGSL